jgi:DNA-binding response OmpR family regulator
MRLLVIEDNRSLVANLFDYFEARGHTLDAAPDGPTGLHLATTQTYDAILLDWGLPRMDGKELLCRLRAGPHGNVPVLMLTARDELPDKIAGFRAGADDYMTKPFALPELEVRLEAVLARAGAQSQPRAASGRSEAGSGDTGGHARGPAAASVPGVPALLEVLMQASPAAVGRERLEQALWGDEPPDGDMLRSHL